ncbi:hypothetical protein MHUMG1_08325 [Metarhizium humberi]|uniref:Peptidase S1 domain-containing protein n=1 Tax=Metarhizium humberi TaxID=2596975 RepID=A0A9P8S4Q3_9HYPO|nr:hypothetical protein MHUMG1_08325 [Metarhizium humberi]
MVRVITITLAAVFSTFLVSAATIHKRLIGGEYAKGGEFPFIVSIRQGGSHICGGSLLDSTTVLTAAHCIKCLDFVRAGTLDSRQGGVEVEVASAALHPRYSRIQRHDDIAILKLATPIEESDTIRYATLPASGSDPVLNTTAVVAGCKVNITIHERGECSEKLKLGAVEDIICAGDDGKDACEGDSGGPLVDPVTGHVIGLVTWGQCRDPPTAYTRVSSYIDFINGFVGGSDSSPLFNLGRKHFGTADTLDSCIKEARSRREFPPGKPQTEIVGRLFHACLDENPGFEALSYTWGSPSPTYDISINACAFPVSGNLRKALDDLRYPDKPRILWADAICINQRDSDEKAHQLDHSVQAGDSSFDSLCYPGKGIELDNFADPSYWYPVAGCKTFVEKKQVREVKDGTISKPPFSSLLQLFLQSGTLDMAEPRDQLYGILGLIPQADESQVRVDYNAPVVKVHSQVFSIYLSNHNSLDFLCFSRKPADVACRGDTIPTWTPNAPTIHWSQVYASQAAGSTTANAASIDSESLVLSVQGLLLDKIAFVARRQDFDKLPVLEWFSILENYCTRLWRSDPQRPLCEKKNATLLLFPWLSKERYREMWQVDRPTSEERRSLLRNIRGIAAENDAKDKLTMRNLALGQFDSTTSRRGGSSLDTPWMPDADDSSAGT